MTHTAQHAPVSAPKVLTQATLRAAECLGLNHAQLARVLGVSPATVIRLAQGASTIAPGSKTGELALLVIRLFRLLDSIVGNPADAAKWMAAPNTALSGAPRDLIATAQGLVHVTVYLDAYQARL
jgi:plasmid maintenance system antidote protein VapI